LGPPRCSRPFRSATARRQVRIPRPYPRPATTRARVVIRARCSNGDADSHRWGLGIGSRAATPRAATHPTHPWAASGYASRLGSRAAILYRLVWLSRSVPVPRDLCSHIHLVRAHIHEPLGFLFSAGSGGSGDGGGHLSMGARHARSPVSPGVDEMESQSHGLMQPGPFISSYPTAILMKTVQNRKAQRALRENGVSLYGICMCTRCWSATFLTGKPLFIPAY
jgi:hypothetical protein